jgi:hypothetical protein
MKWHDIRFRVYVITHLINLGKLPRDSDYYSEPDKSIFSGLTWLEMFHGDQLGPKTIREVEMWLGESFPRHKYIADVSPATIEKAILLLRKHGYSVKPTLPHSQDQAEA